MILGVPAQLGYPALFGLVLAESAGMPVPGETALLAASGLAAAGHLAFPAVVATAATGAILGDGIGYWVGRRGGRALLLRDGRFASHRRRAAERADAFFARYGVVAVFLARWVPGVRVVGALTAGAARMPWRRFTAANAAGAVAWASSVAALAALVGPGVMAAVGVASATVALIGGALAVRRRRRVQPRTAVRERRFAVPSERPRRRWRQHVSGATADAAG